MYDDMGYDETHEFLTEYTKRGGMYDILCPACNGKNVVKAECKCSDCEADRQELADMYEMEAAERRFGC